MPTVADLERLDALINRLVPLANTQRGTPVRAQDWNEVVGTLIEVARIVLAEEREGVVASHEHSDQVKMGWLDPMLRAIVERGPLADPAAITRVQDIERRLGRLTNRIDEVDAGAKEAHDRATSMSTRDLVREAQVTAVRRTVEGLADSRDSVLELRNSLRTIEDQVNVAVDAAQRLVVDGQPVDLAAWDQRLRSLEELRTRLTQPDGSLLDAGALEIRLTELTNTLVTEEELDEALASRPITVPPEELAALQEEVRAAVAADVESSMAQLGDEIRAQTDEKLAGIDARVAQAVADAEPGIVESVLGTVRPEIAQAADATLVKAQGLIDESLAELRETLTAELDQKLAGLQQQLGALAEELKVVQTRLDEHDEILRRLQEPSSPDDFTRIQGIDEAAAKRLVDAGVETFAELAAMSPERIGAIIGMDPEKVIALKIVAQAEDLARTG